MKSSLIRHQLVHTGQRLDGKWGVRSVENAEYEKCGVWKMQSVENVECGKCGVRRNFYGKCWV